MSCMYIVTGQDISGSQTVAFEDSPSHCPLQSDVSSDVGSHDRIRDGNDGDLAWHE